MKKHNIYRLSGLLKARLKAMSLLITIMLPACSMGQSEQFNQYKQIASEQHERYLKIDEKGQVLPKDAQNWSCVYDNKTQLLWEEKTDDGGLRDKDWLYTYYDPDSWSDDPKERGFIDVYDAGVREMIISGQINNVSFKESLAFTKSGQTANGTLPKANTYEYAKAVNQLNLCGVSEWRVPRTDEDSSIFLYKDGKYAPVAHSFEDKQHFFKSLQDKKETMVFLDPAYFKQQPYIYRFFNSFHKTCPYTAPILKIHSNGSGVIKEAGIHAFKNTVQCIGYVRLVAGKKWGDF